MEVMADQKTQLYRIQTDPGRTAGAAMPGVATMTPVGPLGLGAQIVDTPTNFEQGALDPTGNPLDLALQGNAFFTIGTPQGVRYTRDGNFERDAQGILRTQDGNVVLGQNGPITIPPTGTVQVDSDGTINVKQDNPQSVQRVDQLILTQFANPFQLRPEGANRFVDYGAQPSANTTTTTVQQGMLEKSNADIITSMVGLITNERWFDANEKSIQTQD